MSAAKKQKLDAIMYPVLSDDLIEETPLIKAYVAKILEPKTISKIVIELNAKLPVPQLNHLKRIRLKEALLFPFEENTNVLEHLKSKDIDTKLFAAEVNVVEVAKIAPKTKRQYDVVNKLWPCNFHSNKYLEKLCTNTLFNDEEITNHLEYMKVCIDIAKFSDGKIAAIVVDPKINSIVAIGCDGRSQNPCKHAIMLAIDNTARTQGGGAWKEIDAIQKSSEGLNLCGIPKKNYDLLAKYANLRFGAVDYKSKDAIVDPSDGPYLCTNYYVYVTREPCVMCAMALIHSRVKRVFYGCKNDCGGLGSLCKIHTVKDLNHHYEVFAGLLEGECSNL